MEQSNDTYTSTVTRLKRIGRYSLVARMLSQRMGKTINQSWVSHVASGVIADAGFKRFSSMISVLDDIEADRALPEMERSDTCDKAMSGAATRHGGRHHRRTAGLLSGSAPAQNGTVSTKASTRNLRGRRGRKPNAPCWKE